jgi:hypothetical protein
MPAIVGTIEVVEGTRLGGIVVEHVDTAVVEGWLGLVGGRSGAGRRQTCSDRDVAEETVPLIGQLVDLVPKISELAAEGGRGAEGDLHKPPCRMGEARV